MKSSNNGILKYLLVFYLHTNWYTEYYFTFLKLHNVFLLCVRCVMLLPQNSLQTAQELLTQLCNIHCYLHYEYFPPFPCLALMIVTVRVLDTWHLGTNSFIFTLLLATRRQATVNKEGCSKQQLMRTCKSEWWFNYLSVLFWDTISWLLWWCVWLQRNGEVEAEGTLQ
jgi:hypothetical protein